MKKLATLILINTLLFSAFAQSPASFSKRVKFMPRAFERPSEDLDINDNSSKSNLPWIVFSDREENYTYTVPGGSLIMKKLNFMEAFYVSKEDNGFVKLIKYVPGMVRGRKINNKKSAQSYGWIAKSKVLLWQRSYTNAQTGYAQKAISIINGKNPLTEPKFYYDQTDSVYIYASPELKNKITKIRLHEINYIYKKSEDGKKYLVGNEDQLIADAAGSSIYGWVSADAIHAWGERLYISTTNTDNYQQDDTTAAAINASLLSAPAALFKFDPLLPTNQPVLRSLPVLADKENPAGKVAIATDVYDRSQNTLTTINGSQLRFTDYIKLRQNIHRINVVFVVDGGSTMTNYFSGLTNTIQGFENIFSNYSKNNTFSYGAVVYRNTANCATTGLSKVAITPDYRPLMSFLNEQARVTANCNNRINNQPVFNGIYEAVDMLKSKPNETNLIILVGSTGDGRNINYELNQLSNQIANANARLLSIQVNSDFDQSYNNFVIQSRKLVSEAAGKTAERKKQFMVKGEGLSPQQSFNVSRSDSISYYLDFPANSLIQGGVVFPTKGSVKSNQAINTAIRRFIKETDFDINTQIHDLDSAFRLTGIQRKNLSPLVEKSLTQPVEENVADNMPHNTFKYFTTANIADDVVEKNGDLLQYSIILNTMEYKQFSDITSMMKGENLQPDKSSFRRKLVKNYLSICKNQLGLDLAKGEIKQMTLAAYIKTVSGLPVKNQLLTNKVVDLKRTAKMPQDKFEAYLNYLINTTQAIKRATQIKQQFTSNGKTYYYITGKNFELSKN